MSVRHVVRVEWVAVVMVLVERYNSGIEGDGGEGSVQGVGYKW